MGGYIRMDKDLDDDPRVHDLGEALARERFGLETQEPENYTADDVQTIGLACDAVIGALYRLWRYGDTYLGRHDRLKGASRGLARIAEVTALPMSLLRMFPIEWLLIHTDGSIELPGYASKNALINRDKRREGGRERTRRYREKKRKQVEECNDVTQRHIETSQRHQNVTTGTGTGTGPEPEPPNRFRDRNPGGESRETPAHHGALASAQGHLARRVGLAKTAGNAVTHTSAELEAFAHRMAADGADSDGIARTLEPLGATAQQVRQWLANAPQMSKTAEGGA